MHARGGSRDREKSNYAKNSALREMEGKCGTDGPFPGSVRSSPPVHARHARILQGCEQNRRSPRPALLRNQRPQLGAGQRAHWIRPANSSAKRW